MHTWVKRAAVVGLVALSQTVVSTSALAEINDDIPENSEEFSHAAEFVAAAGGGSGGGRGSPSCTLPRSPYDSNPDPNRDEWTAHLEWNSYEMPDGTWSVWLNCVHDDENVPNNDEDIPFPPPDRWSVVWHRDGVVPRDPQEMATEVLSRLRPGTADIHTDPADGIPAYVGTDTFFWLDEGVYGPQTVTESEGPIVDGAPLLSVTIDAWPAEGGLVTWDTGDGVETCDGNVRCPHEYTRSSAGQGQDDTYTVTATYAYTGTYTTTVMGEVIDTGDLGLIYRTSETTLAVAEAQALNTGG